MALGDSAAILLRVKADTGDAIRGLKGVQAETKGLGTSVGSMASSFAASINPLTLAGAAITGIAAAALATTKQLFDLSKAAADYGSAIFDASQKTGLGAESLSALKFSAEQAGTSFEQVVASVSKFGVEVGKAAQGNDEAIKKMARLQVTSTDLDTALAQVFRTINKGQTDTQKLALANDAFGRSGREMIGVIKDANGNLDEMVKKAKALGVTIDDDAARAADEFGDQLALLNTQLTHVAHTIGFAVMPVFSEMAQDFSNFLVTNKEEIKAWAETIAIGFRQAVKSVELFVKLINAATTGNYTDFITTAGRVIQGEIADQSRIKAGVGGSVRPTGGIPDAADDAAKKADEIRKREIAAQLTFLDELDAKNTAYLARNRQQWVDAYEANAVTDTQFREAVLENERRFRVASLAEIDKTFQIKRAAEKKLGTELAALKIEEENEKQKVIDESFEREQKAEEAIAAKKEEVFKQAKSAIDRETELHKAATDAYISLQEKRLAQQEIAENVFISRRQLAEIEFLEFRRKKLDEELKLVTGNAEEELRVKHEIALLENEQQIQSNNFLKENGELAIRNAKELLELKKAVREEERRILDFRREQERKVLVNTVDSSSFKEKQEAKDALEAFDIEEANRRNKQRLDDIEAERQAALERVKGRENEEAQKLEIEQIANAARVASAEELAGSLQDIADRFKEGDEEGGIFGAWSRSWDDFFNKVTNEAPSISATLNDLSGILQGAFQGMANAIGNLVEQWVLYGETGPAMMRKILAAALASIAAEAAVRAIYELAAGFASLFFNPAEATAHFTAAAIFGSIAVGAALVGRAIAGDSFKKQTATATGGASGTAGQTSSDTSSQGQVYSGRKDAVQDVNINAPQSTAQVIEVRFTEKPGWFGSALDAEVSTNGKARQTIKLVAQDA